MLREKVTDCCHRLSPSSKDKDVLKTWRGGGGRRDVPVGLEDGGELVEYGMDVFVFI